VHPHEIDLRSYLRWKFPSLSAELDDLIQEAYSRLFQAWRAGKVAEVRPYLFATARNAAVDVCRHNHVVTNFSLGEIERLPVASDEPNAAEAASHDQELELLRKAIQVLPNRCREVVILRRLHELSVHEIAQRLEISEKTVDAQLCIGVFRLREYLKAHGVSQARLRKAKDHALGARARCPKLT
jgi:RNA polymerase sigma-70 factor (ECF subfamily)